MAERQAPEDFNADNVCVREVEVDDLENIYDLWKTENWADFGLKTLRFVFDKEICPNKGFVAEYKGLIIGVGFAHAVNDEIGELGGLFVRPGFRRFGIGRKIWEARMAYLGDRNVMVYSLNKRAQANMKLGFGHKVQELNEFVGVPDQLRTDPFTPDDNVDEIIPIRDVNFEKLLAFDATLFFEEEKQHPIVDRRQHLNHFIHRYSERGFVAFKSGQIVGYIDEMPADGFAVLGPWYAENRAVAKTLLKRFVCALPVGTRVHFLSPATNEDAQAIVRELGYEKIGVDTVLFNKRGMAAPWHRVYSCRCFVANLW